MCTFSCTVYACGHQEDDAPEKCQTAIKTGICPSWENDPTYSTSECTKCMKNNVGGGKSRQENDEAFQI